MSLTRRHFLALAGGLAAAGLVWSDPEAPSLRRLAQKKGVLFGSAVNNGVFSSPVALSLLKAEAALVTPENEMKWYATEPQAGVFDFTPMQQIEAFCQQHGAQLRGHVLVWYKDAVREGGWLKEALSDPAAARRAGVMEQHIARVMGRYKGRLHSVDVVNEAIDYKNSAADGLRRTPWLDAYGADYVRLAFEVAADADPTARLVYNEHLLEYDTVYYEKRRTALLKMFDRLQAKNTPVHAIGLQSHLWADQPFKAPQFQAFLRDLHQRGLEVMITEFDVNTSKMSGSQERIEQAMADHARAYLEAVFSAVPVKTFVCWGLKDQAKWNGYTYARADQKAARLLPFDRTGEKRPLYHAVSEVLRQIQPIS